MIEDMWHDDMTTDNECQQMAASDRSGHFG